MANRLKKAQALFEQATDLPPEKRRDFLIQAAGGDETLVTEVEELLRHDAEANDSLFVSLDEQASDVFAAKPRRETIGRYRVVRELGQGGMGTVYLARRDDEEYDIEVAIKLVPAVLDRDELMRRFRSERQIMASLEHSNIARLLDGDTTSDGVPYVVMEYVQGVPIDQYCRDNALGIDERLALFRQVCSAVSHAHRNLVIHRDIKPGNILVTNEGVPKLLDFGIAKILDTDGPMAASLTRSSMRMMTPEYASPEQVRGTAITTATDVYSLGVLLHKLLTDELPYTLDTRELGAVERIICEQPPQIPSRVNPDVGGELDDIVSMALRKEADRRYPSVAALSDDLDRLARAQPIVARPDSTAYRIRKFVQRNRLGATAAAVVLVALVTGLSVATYGLVKAREAEAQAQKEAAISRSVSQSFMQLFKEADRYGLREAEMTVNELLDSGLERFLKSVEGQPEVLASVSLDLARIYQEAGFPERARTLFARAELALEAVDEPPKQLLFDIYRHRINVGNSVSEAEHRAQVDTFREWQEYAFPDSPLHRAQVLMEEKTFARRLGMHQRELDLLLEEQRVRQPLEQTILQRSELLADIGFAYTALDQNEQAVATADEAFALLESVSPSVETYNVFESLYTFASESLIRLGREDEGLDYSTRMVELADRLFTDVNVNFLWALGIHANNLRMVGNFESSSEAFAKIFSIYESMLADEREYRRGFFTDVMNDAAVLEMKLGKYEQADRYLAEVIAMDSAAFGENDLNVLVSWFNRACNAALAGNTEDALDHLRTIVDRGYPYDDLSGDSDLDSLRDLPEFRQLLAEHQAFLAALNHD